MKIEKLSFSYKKKEIFTDLSAVFSNDKVNVITGRNGCGKTTLLNILARDYTKYEGKIINQPNFKDIIFQIQSIPFLTTLTGEDIVDFFLGIGVDEKEHSEKKETIFSELTFNNVKSIKIRDMSLGERRYLMISCICLLDRKVFLFDEPTSGIDPINSTLILKKLEQKNQKALVIFTTHELEKLAKIDCHINFIHDKKIIFSGSYDDFISQSTSNQNEEAYANLINREMSD